MPSEDTPATSSGDDPNVTSRDDRHAPSDGATPPYSAALLTIPYAVPFTFGIVFLVTGSADLHRLFTTYYGSLRVVFETLVVLTVGSILLLYGGAGALSTVIKESTGN